MTLLLGAVSLVGAAPAFATGDTLAVTSSVDSATPAKTADAGAVVTITVTADSGSNKDGAFTDNVTLTSSDNADKVTYTGNSGTVSDAATTAAVGGVATFSVTLSGTAGSHTFTATDAGSGGATSGNEAITDVGAPTKLVLSDAVSGTAADGGSPTLTVKAEDAAGDLNTSYTGHVKLTSSVAADTGITAEATAVAGVATFTPTLKGTGTHTFTAKDESSANLASGNDAITVTAGTATKLIVTTSDDTASGSTPAKTAIAGATATVTVTAEDAEGAVATGYTGTVSLSSSSADAWVKDGATGSFTAPTGTGSGYTDGSYTFTSGPSGSVDNGVATFTVTINKSGSDEFEASVTGLEAVSDTLTVKAGAMDKFGVAITTTAPTANAKTCSASSPTATSGGSQCWIDGEPIAVKVTAEDAEGNTVTGYTGTMTLAGSDNDAVTYATSNATNYTFTTANAGVKTFAVKLQGCEELTSGNTAPCSDLLTATDTTTSSETGASTAYVVPGSVVRLVLAAPSSYKATTGIVSGATTVYTTTPENSYGEPVAPFTDKIHFSSSDEWAELPSSEAYTYGSSNAAEQDNITLHTPGNETITVKDLTTKTITASTVVMKVTAGAAHHLDIFADDNAEDGQTIPVTVAVMDSSDFPVTSGYTGTVTLSSTGSNSGYNAIPTGHTLTDGVHTFLVQIKGCTSGTCTDTFTAGDGTISQRVSFVVHVTPGAVTQLVVSAGGSTSKTAGAATAGTAATGVTVAAENAYGQIVSDYSGTVHFTSSDDSADLPANYTFTGGPDTSATCGGSTNVTCTDGWGTFANVTFNTAGNQTLVVKQVNHPTIAGTAKVTVAAA
ncbi:MAG: beta strand repeat-containing protein [Solirubrobacteraceae bacterium]